MQEIVEVAVSRSCSGHVVAENYCVDHIDPQCPEMHVADVYNCCLE